MKSQTWILILLIIGAACAFGGYKFGGTSTELGSSNSTVKQDGSRASVDRIVGQGNLQPASGTINVVAPPGERIETLMVKLGQQVKKDDPLAVLASQKVRKLELDLAESRRSDADAQASMLSEANSMKAESASIAGGEIKEAMAKVENQKKAIPALEVSLQSASKMLEKLSNMRANPVTRELVGQNEIDTQQALFNKIATQLRQAKGEIEIANQAIERSRELSTVQQQLAELNAQAPQKSVPKRTLNLAIKAAELALDASTLKSPVDGRILDLAIHQGDTVMNRPIMLIADTSKMVCIAEITDTQLKEVKPGQTVTMLSDAFSEGEIAGRVLEVGNMIAPPSMKDPNPFAAVDRKTGTVTIEIESEHCAEAGRFVNLQVEVRIVKELPKIENPKPASKTDDTKPGGIQDSPIPQAESETENKEPIETDSSNRDPILQLNN